MTAMATVDIVGLQLDPDSGIPVVLLAESGMPDRVLPILVGPAEAQSIALAVAGLRTARPGTHDLLVTILEKADARLEEVAVTELVDGVFFAELFVEMPTGLQRISARPSDGIAIALRVGVPIVVAESVLDDAAVPVSRAPREPFSESEIESIVADFHRRLDSLQPSDFASDDRPDSDHPDDGADDDAADPGCPPANS
jgi:bifunctional DNase/RNase